MAGCPVEVTVERTVLTEGWRLKQLDPARELDGSVLREAEQGAWSEGWFEVGRMPAMVHDVLLSHGVIETPWLPGRAEACRWVAERDWVYATRFSVADPSGQHFLRFKGLDTIVDVYLNGERIAQQSNAFMPLRVDVGGRLRNENTLVLHFRTVFDPEDRSIVRFVDGDPSRPVRRPQNNYNTYLGPQPYYSRVGVYDDVVLEAVGAAEIGQLVVDVALSDDLATGRVIVEAGGLSQAQELELDVRLLAPDGAVAERASTPIHDCRGNYRAEATILVHDPELWWPRGYGGQPLYQVEVTLLADGEVADREVRTAGFRRVTMPEMLHFEVNGVPVRLWGGNWVSPDWVTTVWNPERVERLLDIAENAHFSAFRVWGVVEAPDNHFYEQADRRGFLLWQDFTVLPLQPDEVSRAICREQAAHLIRRLKHHPSVLMWCGGNEAAMWNESEYGGPGGEWPGRVPAEQDVAEVCQELDPARFYLPNSPYHGIDANDPKQGDTHGYTNMWYVPGYDDLVFASEDTRIAAPPLRSLKRFFAPQDLWPEAYSPVYRHGDEYPWPESWMRYTTSLSWKKTGPVEQFYDATNPAELVYRLGMAEALYYRETIERQRRGRPASGDAERRICGGYLVWKYNDSWPQIYSGKVDYFLEPYIPYYAIKRAYAPVLLSLEVGTYVWLWVVNDSPTPVEGQVTVQLFHLPRNEVVTEIVRPVQVRPDRSSVVVRLDEVGIGTFYRDHVLYACLRDAQGQVTARANAMADIERRVTFPRARLDVQVRDDGALVLSTDRFARSVVVEGDADGDAFGWLFEDNWFDLLPGERKVVRVLGEHARGRITARAWYSPHVTAVDWVRRVKRRDVRDGL
jgi:beta-mannosidase